MCEYKECLKCRTPPPINLYCEKELYYLIHNINSKKLFLWQDNSLKPLQKPQKGTMPMNTTNLKKFKGGIEQYLATELQPFDTKITRVFDSLRAGTLMALSKSRKQ